MKVTIEDQVFLAAVSCAKTHQREFPKQPLSGDWDSEAWTETVSNLHLNSCEAELMWPLFQNTLRDEIADAVVS